MPEESVNEITNSTSNPNSNSSGYASLKIPTSAGLKLTESIRYSDQAEIPVDVELPQGLIYKVQIGAFRNPIKASLFNGISPLTGEKTGNGITRYTAGMFKSFTAADVAKNRVQTLGYKDAFVVVFYNGKRISLTQSTSVRSEASASENVEYEIAKDSELKDLQATSIDASNDASTSNVVTQTERESQDGVPSPEIYTEDQPLDSFNEETENNTQKSLNKVSGIYYTVQVGVYSKPKTSAELNGVSPIQTFTTSNGYLRYSTGVYRNAASATARKNQVVSNGISDAYVVAYKDGVRITVEEANEINGVEETSGANETNSIEIPSNTTVNNSASGITFKVQLGIFSREIEVRSNPILNQLSSFGVDFIQTDNGQYVYTAGSLASKQEADELRSQVVNLGLVDAFIIAYQNGNRISVSDAIALTEQ